MPCDIIREWLADGKLHVELECNLPTETAAEAETMIASEGEPVETAESGE